MICGSSVLMSMYCIVCIKMCSARSKAASIVCLCHNESSQIHSPCHSIKEQWLISMNLMSRPKNQEITIHQGLSFIRRRLKLCVFSWWMMHVFLTIWWNQEVNLLCVAELCRSLQDLATRQLSLLQHPTIRSLWFNQPSSLIKHWSLLRYAVDTI